MTYAKTYDKITVIQCTCGFVAASPHPKLILFIIALHRKREHLQVAA
jgi:hypothetical protein